MSKAKVSLSEPLICRVSLKLFFVDGNQVIVELKDFRAQSSSLLADAQSVDPSATGLSIFFTYRFINFEWKPASNAFQPIKFDCALPYDTLRSTFTAPERFGNESLRNLQRMKFGRCEVEVPPKTVTGLLLQEVLNPFYLFQVWSIGLWAWETYYAYAVCIMVISTASVITSLVDTIRNNNNIREMARYSC